MTKQTKPKSDEEIKKFLSEKVKSSGLSLENDVSRFLKQNYIVKREVPFYDKDEQKGRTFDVLARKFFPNESDFDKGERHSVAQYNLIIECKNLPGHVWVFDYDELETFTIPEHSSINKGKKPDPVYNVIPYDPIPDIPFVSGYSEYWFDEKKSNKKDTNLFSAIMSTTKASNHMKNSLDKLFDEYPKFHPAKQAFILHFAFFQPVIVFTGKIFISKFHEGKTEFFRTKFVQMNVGYESKEYHITSGNIHIVEYEYLEEYIKMVDKHYRQKENKMIKNKKIFLECLNMTGFNF